MAFADDFDQAAFWSLKMASIGPEELIRELPASWQRAAYAALFAVSLTTGYFILIATPQAETKSQVISNSVRIDKVEKDIGQIKTDVGDIKSGGAARDQKMDDMNQTISQINEKLDRLLIRGQKPSPYP